VIATSPDPRRGSPVTCHRLITTDVATVAGHVRAQQREHPLPPTTPRWFPRGVPRGGLALTWLDGWIGRDPGWSLWCCLELERAAHGTLAHLTATPVRGGTVPPAMSELALRAWTSLRLRYLAHGVEERSGCASRR
jgi:hypothetical protein